jgi:putative ABC transport system permease protein
MGAYWVVLAAAALTTLIAAAAATALAVFAGQALPLAVRHDLAAAPGTSLALSGPVGPGQSAQDSAALGGIIASALHRVPFSFYRADWSDPLGLVAGSRPARPASAGPGNVPVIQAGSLGGITARAVLELRGPALSGWAASASSPDLVIIARLYPLALRVMLRMFGGRAGPTGFVGLARAARTSLTPTLPVFALVLALTLAAFAGMVRDAITRGEIAASWQVAGADAVIQAGDTGPVVTPAAQRAIGAVPGVRKTASAWLGSWTLPDSQQVVGVAVDPASYAALVASTQTWPQIPAAKLAQPAGTQPVPVLASPSVAASLGGGGTMTTQSGLRPLRVRVAGVLSGTPAVPGSTAFFVVPLSAVQGDLGPVLPLNLMLVTGSGIDASALTAIAQRMIPGSLTTTRSAALSALSGAPLQHGTYLIFALTIAAAAGLGLVVMVLELALEATDRELTLARMATMGLASRQRIWLTLVEVLPALLAAAVAATGCALALPRLLGPALDLSVFTGSGAPVRVLPDFASFALPLAGLALLAAAALAIETRTQQRRGIAAQLRGGG